MIKMNQVTEHIWIFETEFKMGVMEIGGRMTVIDVDGKGNLLIHSPIRPTPEILDKLKQLGEIHFILAPNLFHHLFVGPFLKAFPNAKAYCAPGLEKKRKDIAWAGVVENGQTYPWGGVLQFHRVEGTPLCNEVVLFDTRSRTLILTDLALNVRSTNSWTTKWLLRLIGAYQNFGWSKTEKFIFVRQKDRFQESTKKILAWDFDQVLLCHGDIVKSGGKQQFEKSFGG